MQYKALKQSIQSKLKYKKNQTIIVLKKTKGEILITLE